jgi:predicted O-linked N-acetylglucosamine transferase (SPINDLY family)
MRKIGMSTLCPCGSKRNFKKCCLNGYLMTAYQQLQNGELQQSEALCREVLDREPSHSDALQLGGMVQHKLGNYERAEALMRKSIKVSPGQAAFYCNLGDLYRDQKRLDEAVSCYRQGLKLDPGNVEACNNFGTNLKDQGKFEEAAAAFRKTISLNPRHAAAHYNLGEVLSKLDQPEEAELSFQRSVELDANYFAPALHSKGMSFYQKGMLEDAKSCFQQVLARNPGYAPAYVGLGAALSDQGDLDQAVELFLRAIALDPALVWAHNNLGNAALVRGDFDAAVAYFQKALSLDPQFAMGAYNLGNSFLGNAAKGKCRLDEAIVCYQRALAIKPDFTAAYCNMLMAYQYSFASNQEIFDKTVEFGRRFEPALEMMRPMPYRDGNQAGAIRVGLVSGDLKEHPVALFLEAPLRHIDKEAFSLVAYANQDIYDEVSARIRPFFSDWVKVIKFSDEELAARIRADRIDILIDLSGHTADNRLLTFALAPAPVQVTWLGYPHTTGMTSIDYVLADPVTIPEEEERFYTEKVWRLPETYICFAPRETEAKVNALPALETGKVTFGCFNNPAKLNDVVIATWAAVLQAVPGSRMLFKYWSHYENAVARERCLQRFSAFGIDPARLGFEAGTDRETLFSTYNLVDLALDPFPYNGVTTTLEAAWMGVPTLTLSMPRGIIAHNGELIMKSLGLSGWVAESVEEYLDKAQAFARETANLASIRTQLRQRLLDSPLCDGKRFARHLEQAFAGMKREGRGPKAETLPFQGSACL